MLPNGAGCNFTCDSGYEAVGQQPSCGLGHTNSTITCEPLPIYACVDSKALNFEPTAVFDDGSCNYTCASLAHQFAYPAINSSCVIYDRATSTWEGLGDFLVGGNLRVAAGDIVIMQGLSSVSGYNSRVEIVMGQFGKTPAISRLVLQFSFALRVRDGSWEIVGLFRLQSGGAWPSGTSPTASAVRWSSAAAGPLSSTASFGAHNKTTVPAETPRPHTLIFSMENAVCKDSYRCKCRRNRLLRSVPTSLRILTDSVLQRENKRTWAPGCSEKGRGKAAEGQGKAVKKAPGRPRAPWPP